MLKIQQTHPNHTPLTEGSAGALESQTSVLFFGKEAQQAGCETAQGRDACEYPQTDHSLPLELWRFICVTPNCVAALLPTVPRHNSFAFIAEVDGVEFAGLRSVAFLPLLALDDEGYLPWQNLADGKAFKFSIKRHSAFGVVSPQLHDGVGVHGDYF